MSAASPWHRLHACATFEGETGERESFTGSTPCAPWQLAHCATLVSPSKSFWACLLVRYSESWSTRSDGLKCFIRTASPWHLPQRAGISFGANFPWNSFFGSCARSWSCWFGSPPWHEAQVKPARACTSCANARAGGERVSSSIARWHSAQRLVGGAWSLGAGGCLLYTS